MAGGAYAARANVYNTVVTIDGGTVNGSVFGGGENGHVLHNTRVTVNGRPAKASYDVKVGDEIEITMGARVIRAKVLTVVEHATKETAGEMYQLL